MLAYYFEYTDTFTVNVQGFFCYEGAYRKPYPGPEDRSAVPPVLLYSLTAGVPVLVVSWGRRAPLVVLDRSGPGRAGEGRGSRPERCRRRGLRAGPAGGDGPSALRGSARPGAPAGSAAGPGPCPTVPTAPLKFIFSTVYVTASACISRPVRLLLVKNYFFFFETRVGLQVDGQPEENPGFSSHLLMCHPVLIRKPLCQFWFVKVNWYVQGTGSSFYLI